MADPCGAGYPLLNRDPELDSELACDCLGLLHDPRSQCPGLGAFDDLEQSRAGQRTDRIECQIPHQLDPDFLPDVRPDGAPDSGASKSLRNRAASLAL